MSPVRMLAAQQVTHRIVSGGQHEHANHPRRQLQRLAAQHTEIIQLRAARSGTGNLRTLRQIRPAGGQTTTRNSAPTFEASRTFTEVTVHAGVLAVTADLIELLHDFLDDAGPDLRTNLGRFLASRVTEPTADPPPKPQFSSTT